jgi:hypothetical protein
MRTRSCSSGFPTFCLSCWERFCSGGSRGNSLPSRPDYTEPIPAFLIVIGIPLSYSIADGLALGFISYAIIKAFTGRSREISWLTYALAIVLVLYFVFVRSRMG